MTLIICLIALSVFAQTITPDPDSLAYQNQRKKINTMLAQRVAKFGDYTISLGQHTGIFGLQTKKDIRRSNEILMDITRTDNAILEQTKVLLSLKDNQLKYRSYQQQTVQSQAKETQDVSIGYMTTINKLRVQNEKLTAQLRESEDRNSSIKKWAAAIVVVIIGLILFVNRKRTRN
ncbi:hypothetical protein GO620_006955 [Mucilaginibacter ginkgonis]|uniref:Uncharacterized protein n=1 Tax=Mucilaginibacter ginkgonis TaxID=2682091 RepID=A0A6I4IN56_9SPHI|nr:hypothetical protein GO620_006955 [Mucilaginibacter ginkgonis]